MTTIEYDLDLTGGLMEDIRRLVAPPQIERDRSKKHRVQDRQQQQQRRPASKPPNHDCCDSCKEGGDLLCCDRCSAAFHLQCHDPPLEEDDVPTGQWLCRKCCNRPAVVATPATMNGDSQDEETASTCSSRSRHSELPPSKSRSSASSNCKGAVTPLTPRGLGDVDDNYADVEFSADDIAASSQNPLLLLSAAAKQLNPRQFDLPKDIICPVNFPGSSKYGKRKAGPGVRAVKKSIFEMENGLVPLPAKLCFVCGRSCRVGLLLQCDYCPLLFHLDCLNPPLTAPPSGRWMCPNHVEHTLVGARTRFDLAFVAACVREDDRLLSSVRLSERILLWNKFTGPFDPHTVKIDFLNKIHFAAASSLGLPQRQRPRRAPLKVPTSVKSMYGRGTRRPPWDCLGSEVPPFNSVPVTVSQLNPLPVPARPEAAAGSAAGLSVSCEPMQTGSAEPTQASSTVCSSELSSRTGIKTEQKQWLQSVLRLNTDISRMLASTVDVLPAAPVTATTTKPTASVHPQLKTECIDDITSGVSSAATSASDISIGPAPMLANDVNVSPTPAMSAATAAESTDRSEPMETTDENEDRLLVESSLPSMSKTDCTTPPSSSPLPSSASIGIVAVPYSPRTVSEDCGTSVAPQATNTTVADVATSFMDVELSSAVSSQTDFFSCSSDTPDLYASSQCYGSVTAPQASETSDTSAREHLVALTHQDSVLPLHDDASGFFPAIPDDIIASCRAAELEAASTLSGMEQLAAVAAAAIPETGFMSVGVADQDVGIATPVQRISRHASLSNVGSSLATNHSVPSSAAVDSSRTKSEPPPPRAVLYPEATDMEPWPMFRKSLSIGSGVDTDVCLVDAGFCKRTSLKHATIFYDQLSHQFELLNYSEFGTRVDGVLYGCDIVVPTKRPPRRAAGRRRRTANSAAADAVRQLLAQNADMFKSTVPSKNTSSPQESAINGKADHCKPCRCNESSQQPSANNQPADNGSNSNLGWEGSAMLHHGSVIEFGCLRFTFSIMEHAVPQPTTSVIGRLDI